MAVPDEKPAPVMTPGRAAAEAWHGYRFAAGESLCMSEAYGRAAERWDATARAAINAGLPGILADLTEARARAGKLAAELAAENQAADLRDRLCAARAALLDVVKATAAGDPARVTAERAIEALGVPAGMPSLAAEVMALAARRDELTAEAGALLAGLADARELLADILDPARWYASDGRKVLSVHPDHLASWRLRATAGAPVADAGGAQAGTAGDDDGQLATLRVRMPVHVAGDADAVDDAERAAQQWVLEQWPAEDDEEGEEGE